MLKCTRIAGGILQNNETLNLFENILRHLSDWLNNND